MISPDPSDASPAAAALLPENLDLWQRSLHWQPSSAQQQQFQSLYAGILNGNRQMNLTRITTPLEFWEKHLWDSLSGLAPWLQPAIARPPWLPPSPIRTVIDIGTGAGFPGLPAAIAQPEWQVTLLDATQKKIRFLKELATVMKLKTVEAIADRAEFLGHQLSHREQYDLALVRAVGPVATCAEYALPLIKPKGIAVLYRGQWTPDEAHALSRAASKLGGKVIAVQTLQTPLTQSSRHCLYVYKQSLTSEQYPRPVGIPAKQPLAQ